MDDVIESMNSGLAETCGCITRACGVDGLPKKGVDAFVWVYDGPTSNLSYSRWFAVYSNGLVKFYMARKTGGGANVTNYSTVDMKPGFTGELADPGLVDRLMEWAGVEIT